MKGNLILIHGRRGRRAVINASLAGAIRQAKKEPGVDRILAAIGGTGGLMRGQVRDLTDITEEELALLERTPGSAIGTSRRCSWKSRNTACWRKNAWSSARNMC